VYAAFSVSTVNAFFEAGGRFTEHQSESGVTSEMTAASGDADVITSFSKAGGIFTDRKNKDGWTSQMLASNLSEWSALEIAREMKRPVSDALRADLKKQYAARDVAAAKAYQEALVRQGGLRHVP